jgi:hypothetical protein
VFAVIPPGRVDDLDELVAILQRRRVLIVDTAEHGARVIRERRAAHSAEPRELLSTY